jgi:hypothetical protein
MFCPRWTVSSYCSINTDSVVYGTVAVLTCDDGYMFPNGDFTARIRCDTADDDNFAVSWNATALNCIGDKQLT